MTRSAVIASLAIAAIAAAGLATIDSDTDRRTERPASLGPQTHVGEPTPTPAPPAVSVPALERQDRVPSRRRHDESAANDQRPLLTQLPLTRAGVSIDITGLHADGRHTLLTIHHPRSSRRDARSVYQQALRTARDSGRAYRIRYRP